MNQEQINEKLDASAPAKDWIEDFVKSDDPKFDGKTKDERIMMALGAYYAAQKNESVELEENAGYMETLHTKYKFLRRQADEAEEKYQKAKERNLDDDSLETYYTAVRTLNDRADDVYDAYVDARDKAKKNEGSVSLNFDREGEIPVTEGKKVADLKVGDSVRVTISSGTTDWSTGKTTRPEVTAKGTIVKIADTEQSVHAGDIAKEYTVKYKSSLSGRTETSSFRHVTPLTEQKTTDCAIDDLEDAIEDQEEKKKKEKAEGEGTCKTEALDPVGKEDDDVDNDGDSDESDEYLKNRRKTVTKAIQKEEVEELEEGVEAHGVKGSNSTKWRKTFKDRAALNAWVDANDAEVYAVSNDSNLDEGVEEIKARVAKYSVGDKTNFGVIKSISSTSIEFKSKDLPVTKIAFNQRKMGSKDFVLDRLSRMNESFTEARDLKIAQLALRSDGSGKLEDFVKNYSVVGKSILQIKEEYATFLKANKKQEEEGIQNYP